MTVKVFDPTQPTLAKEQDMNYRNQGSANGAELGQKLARQLQQDSANVADRSAFPGALGPVVESPYAMQQHRSEKLRRLCDRLERLNAAIRGNPYPPAVEEGKEAEYPPLVAVLYIIPGRDIDTISACHSMIDTITSALGIQV